jgi:hypothetical protein
VLFTGSAFYRSSKGNSTIPNSAIGASLRFDFCSYYVCKLMRECFITVFLFDISLTTIAQLHQYRNSSTSTIVQIGIKPPHDFTYDLTSLVIQISVPTNYPRSPATIKVQNCDIPKGFAMYGKIFFFVSSLLCDF